MNRPSIFPGLFNAGPPVYALPTYVLRSKEFEAAREYVLQSGFAEADWDGYGAVAMTDDVKRNTVAALYALEQSTPSPNVIANANGTFSLEWETPKGISQLEIGRTRYAFYLRPSVGPVYLADGAANEVPMARSVLSGFVEALLYPAAPEPVYNTVRFQSANV
jgi:hypothetical protein